MLSCILLLAAAVFAEAANIPSFDSPFDAFNLKTRSASGLPSNFKWSSSGPLIAPKSDGRGIAGIKDPSIIEVNGAYHVFASTSQASGYNLVYLSFTDFAQANSATFHYLDQSGIGKGYRAAPQVFFFEPQGLWYLVYQNNNAAYSTNKDINDPTAWSAPTNFFSSEPSIVSQTLAADTGSTCGPSETPPTAISSHPTTTATSIAPRPPSAAFQKAWATWSSPSLQTTARTACSRPHASATWEMAPISSSSMPASGTSAPGPRAVFLAHGPLLPLRRPTLSRVPTMWLSLGPHGPRASATARWYAYRRTRL